MNTLNEICLEMGADKASAHPVKGHDYARHYAQVFDPLRFDTLKLLEIGVGGGESIRSWLEFFPYAHVHGIDIVEKTNEWNTPGALTHPRYQFLQGNQSDKIMWACAVATWGGDFDIIVDDGGHFSGQIITTFECLWPVVRPGGYYAIEDLAAGSTVGTVFLTPGYATHMQWLAGLIEKMNLGENDIAEMHLAPELAIFRKRA